VFINGERIDGLDLLNLLEDENDTAIEVLVHKIGINGSYTIVRAYEDSVEVLCDIVRSFPVFYREKNDVYELTDAILFDSSISIDSDAALEYLTAGYVTGDRTIYKEWRQVRASEALILRFDQKNGFTKSSVLGKKFSRNTNKAYIEEEKILEICESFDKVAENIKKLAKDNEIVIPLSGGLDSRLIAVMCKKSGLKNVSAFSYGAPMNEESRISKNVADALGIQWHFVEYNSEKWAKIINNQALFDYCRSGGSLPHVQDMIAIDELKSLGVLGVNSLILPGHSGDFIGGSHIPCHMAFSRGMSRNSVIEHFIRKHFRLDHHVLAENRKAIESLISSQLHAFLKISVAEAVQCIEEWDLAERQAKYIINSVRGYEFHNIRWFCPLYDTALLSTLENLSIPDIIETYLYRRAVKAYCHEILGDKFEYGVSTRSHWKYFPFYIVEKLSLRWLLPKPDSSEFMGCTIKGTGGRSFLGELARFDLARLMEKISIANGNESLCQGIGKC